MQGCVPVASSKMAMPVVAVGVVYLALALGFGSVEARNFNFAYNYNYNSTRYSFTAPREDASYIADIAAKARGYRDPHGVKVHASMKTVRWINSGRTRCWFGRGCETSSVCGTKCEPILLRVTIPCNNNSNWCPGARKFLRCFPVLCINRNSKRGEKKKNIISRSTVDLDNFVILRWKRPAPKYEREARRNRQTSTQSAIFRS